MPKPTDEDLALRIKNGTPKSAGALTLLVERHHSPLLGYLYRMTNGNRPLAEDLVQETFLRVLRAIDRYQYPRPFKAWLYAIATNLARDHFKRADTRRTDTVPDERLQRFAGEHNPEHRILAEDESRRVIDALTGLPEHQRAALILRYYQELPLAEIANILDIPVGTVKSRLSIGLKRLRATLEEEFA